MLKAAGQKVPTSKPILEINPTHPMVEKLKGSVADDEFTDWSHLLFEQSMLAEGGQLEDPAGFVKRLNLLMLKMRG
jgi:molecular chaperone HtpG